MAQIVIIGAVIGLMFLLQRLVYEKNWYKKLLADIDFDEKELYEGETGRLVETVINDKILPLPILRVKFITNSHLKFDNCGNSQSTDKYYRHDAFRVGCREKIVRKMRFVAEKRGVYSIDSIEMISNDLFMSKLLVGGVNVHSELYVLPKPYESAELTMSMQLINGEMYCKRHLLDDPFTYRGIREYQSGDSMKDVNWKATAKTGELRVNLHDYTCVRYVRLFLNVNDTGVWKQNAETEASFNIAAGIIHMIAANGMEFAFYCNGTDCFSGDIIRMGKSSGRLYEHEVFRSMSRVDLDKPARDFAEAFKTIMTENEAYSCDCIVSPFCDEEFVSFLTSYRMNTGNDFIWFYPSYEKTKPKLPSELAAKLIVIPMWK